MPTLSFENVTSTYFSENTKEVIVALDNLNVTFVTNSINTIVGENGCGKSTLLKCICDFQKYEGTIRLNDKNIDDIPTKNRNIGYVTQEAILNPKLNVFDNIAFSLFLQKMKATEIRQKVYKIAEEFNISHILNRKVNEISKGQQQRAVIAKALVKDPEILLLDEPFSNLDKPNKEIIFGALKNIMSRDNKICIFVTHDIPDALLFSDYIYTMEKGQIINSSAKASCSEESMLENLGVQLKENNEK